MAMVDNDEYTESVAKNPFNFKNFSTHQVVICFNGGNTCPTTLAQFW